MLKKIFIFLLSCWVCIQFSPVLSQVLDQPQALPEVKVLQLRSQEYYQQGNFTQSYRDLQALIQLLTEQGSKGKPNLALALTNLGHLNFAWGRLDSALTSWQEATRIYQDLNQKKSIIYLQLYQAEALQKLGLYPRACETLSQALSINHQFCQAEPITQSNNNKLLKDEIAQRIRTNTQLDRDGFRLLGEILAKTGRPEEAFALLAQIDQIAPSPAVTLALGNTFRAMGNLVRDRQTETQYQYLPWQCNPIAIAQEVEDYYQKAKDNYQKISNDPTPMISAKVKLNQFSLLMAVKQETEANQNRIKEAENLSQAIATHLPQLFTSYSKVYLEINYAKNLVCLQQQKSGFDHTFAQDEIVNLLKKTIKEARDLELIPDFQASLLIKEKPRILESYALGNLGGFYEYLSSAYPPLAQYYQSQAIQLTEEALYLAQPSQVPHLAYQWQWQLGRLWEATGESEKAIANYELAAQTLETVRRDILTVNSDVQFSFRDNIEPLYRGLVNLLLTSQKTKPDSIALQKALDYTEALQLAELENFLGCNLTTTLQTTPLTHAKAAIIYPIILQDRLAIILKIPGQKLAYFETLISHQQVETTLKNLQDKLTQIEGGTTPEILGNSQEVYQWLFKPLEPTLNNHSEIETIVFILEGSLRNIPMSILYDGQKYLLEKNYAIAVVPGLNLLTPQTASSPLKVFAGGVGLPQEFSKGIRFSKIEQLELEIHNISQFVSMGEPLLNERFTQANIQKKLQSGDFSAIHWKTHGTFSSVPQNTFIVAYRELINPHNLSQLVQVGSQNKTKPLELLVLSACDTAQGDRRAILGLSGIAVRSGAASTLSTLWRANDAATTELMTQFYQEIAKAGMTKAKALQKAQLALLKKYKDPYIWATYVLVGSWL